MTQSDKDRLLDEVLNSIVCLEWGEERGLIRQVLFERLLNSLKSMEMILMKSGKE